MDLQARLVGVCPDWICWVFVVFFFPCYESALSFRSELTEEVVFISAYNLIRSNLNIRLPIATLSHALLLCGN